MTYSTLTTGIVTITTSVISGVQGGYEAREVLTKPNLIEHVNTAMRRLELRKTAMEEEVYQQRKRILDEALQFAKEDRYSNVAESLLHAADILTGGGGLGVGLATIFDNSRALQNASNTISYGLGPISAALQAVPVYMGMKAYPKIKERISQLQEHRDRFVHSKISLGEREREKADKHIEELDLQIKLARIESQKVILGTALAIGDVAMTAMSTVYPTNPWMIASCLYGMGSCLSQKYVDRHLDPKIDQLEEQIQHRRPGLAVDVSLPLFHLGHEDPITRLPELSPAPKHPVLYSRSWSEIPMQDSHPIEEESDRPADNAYDKSEQYFTSISHDWLKCPEIDLDKESETELELSSRGREGDIMKMAKEMSFIMHEEVLTKKMQESPEHRVFKDGSEISSEARKGFSKEDAHCTHKVFSHITTHTTRHEWLRADFLERNKIVRDALDEVYKISIETPLETRPFEKASMPLETRKILISSLDSTVSSSLSQPDHSESSSAPSSASDHIISIEGSNSIDEIPHPVQEESDKEERISRNSQMEQVSPTHSEQSILLLEDVEKLEVESDVV